MLREVAVGMGTHAAWIDVAHVVKGRDESRYAAADFVAAES